MWRIPLFDIAFDEREHEAVSAVLRSGWLSMGETVQAFETRFADMVGAEHAVAVSNGTAALHLATAALGVGPGDEVICPSLTFVAGANSIVYTGATPVFADIVGPDDLGLSPEDVERKITPRTRAIQVMHYGGHPCAVERIVEIAARHGLSVIEDAAHAPGAWIDDGRRVGTIGAVGCFSFFPNKNMTTAEGGMVVTNDAALAERMRLTRAHGMTSPTIARHAGKTLTYDVTALGWNYRLDEIRAAIGLAQLDKLTTHNQTRRQIDAWYRARLARLPMVAVPFAEPAAGAAFHIRPILLPEGVDRDAVRAAMRDAGVQTSFHYPPIHLLTHYRNHYGMGEGMLAQTEAVARRAMTLPLYPTMTEAQVDYVVETLERIIAMNNPQLRQDRH